ncbi:hypothetical protein TanjilG_25063 [Lupinus angustifolius]|uniref:S1 motif domain-containing protein n=1 Tax=Lupinus angustifolius TaxID=3871 RepID=A0A1J7GWZ7_LUPAN|nr:hypothetical protein TanjilG_25063 [Lupinus angustifolius]
MQILCSYNYKSFSFPNCTLPLNHFTVFNNTLKNKLHKNQNSFIFINNDAILGGAHVAFSSRNDKFNIFSTNQLSEHEALELLNKPSPVPVENGLKEEGSSEENDLTPFVENFNGSNGSVEEVKENGGVLEVSEERDKKVNVEYYEPKPGDFVVGVVVSGNEDKLNVNVGAELLGTMLTKEVLPLYSKEMEYLLSDMNKVEENSMVQGRMEILKNVDALSGVPVVGSTVLEIGTILFAEVMGKTLAASIINMMLQEKLYLREGIILEGTVKKILPYGAQIRIKETNRSGLLHVSNITRVEITSVSDILSVDEKVKVLVVKSVFPDKISLRAWIEVAQT